MKIKEDGLLVIGGGCIFLFGDIVALICGRSETIILVIIGFVMIVIGLKSGIPTYSFIGKCASLPTKRATKVAVGLIRKQMPICLFY